jgi:hypothetical protein
MVPAFVRFAICALVVLTADAGLSTRAPAVTLSYELGGTGTQTFHSDTTLSLGGSCLSVCFVSELVSISGTGPAGSSTSGWAGTATAVTTDNLGDLLTLAVSAGDVGSSHPKNGGVFFISGLPSVLDVSSSSLASFLGGPGTVDYSISISLPEGVHVTPLPAALPLFVTGLGALGLLGWWRKRKRAILAMEAGAAR